MKVLILAPRTPWPPHSGDRLRTLMWIEALRRDATLVLVTPSPAADARPLDAEVIELRRSPMGLVAGLGRTIVTYAPFHTLATAPWNWKSALADAHRRHGTFDAAIVILTRTDPGVFPFLTARRRILDAIDSAERGMTERARAAHGAERLFWRSEARRSAALERSAASRYDVVTTVSAEEGASFGGGAATIPMGVDIAPLRAGDRRYDFGFWGRFPYFANEEAVRTLLDVIWPEIRRRRPESTLFLGGADAPRWMRAEHGSNGITVVSPAPDRAALRQVRVGILPILRGTGQSLKALEMAEAGCAVIGTSMSIRGVPELAEGAVVEDNVGRIAERAVSLLNDGASAGGARLRRIVETNYDRARSLAMMRALVLEGEE